MYVCMQVVQSLLKKPAGTQWIATTITWIQILPSWEIFERVMSKTGYLDLCQSGSRPRFGTKSALFTLMDDLHGENDKGSATLLLLDLLVPLTVVTFWADLAGWGVGMVCCGCSIPICTFVSRENRTALVLTGIPNMSFPPPTNSYWCFIEFFFLISLYSICHMSFLGDTVPLFATLPNTSCVSLNSS